LAPRAPAQALRATLLYLSRHRGLRAWAEHSGIARRLSSRFIAGKTLSDALTVCRRIRDQGITATLDYLGENVTTLEEAAASRDMCIRALEALHGAGLEPNVSLKLTQFGVDLDPRACEANVSALVETAARIGGFVRIDMESSAYTDRTLDLVRRIHARFGACGAVVQAYLYRSPHDLSALIHEGIRVRLCKGAYLEPPEVAFEKKADVDRHYLGLAHRLLGAASRATEAHPGYYPAIATHDARIIDRVERFVATNHIDRGLFEFQMLYGIRRDLQRRLIGDGYRMRLYVPFGEAWFPYFMRRLAERPANLLFVLRNLLSS
jgi:proline dehydrogenase